jgi:predicted cobalt transporter CbtA
MVGTLLLRGMLVGIVAGLLCFVFLKTVGEPEVDRAIAFETQREEAKAKAKADEPMGQGMSMPDASQSMSNSMPNMSHGMSMPNGEEEPELVSRPVQAGIGLFTAVMVYSAALGGLFALVFALVYGRLGKLGPRAISAFVAGAGFIAISIVPILKYPANPPAVGEPDSIGMRTAFFFAMIAVSLAAMTLSVMVQRRLLASQGAWNATMIASAAYIVVVAAVAFILPTVNEVPEHFPATLLWQFRIASLGAQLILWGTLGLLFGALTERARTTQI